MVNWYVKDKKIDTKPTYLDFAHRSEHFDHLDNDIDFSEKYGEVYLWIYKNKQIILFPLEDLDGHHQLGDIGFYDFSGRYSKKLHTASLSGAGDFDNYIDVLLALEEKLGKGIKIFISENVSGNFINGTFSIDALVKKMESLKVQHVQSNKFAETVKIRDMYTSSPKSVYIARNPSWDELMSMIDRSYYGSLRLLKDQNGDILAWDSKDGIHYQITSALGLNTNAYHADGPEIRIDEKWRLKLHNPPGPYSFNNFYNKKLKSIDNNEYLVVENELV